jgi:hypothetical protein
MKGWRLRSWGVEELDDDESRILRSDIVWTCLELDEGHDIWIDDNALLNPEGVFIARVGAHARVPLPAVILGSDGERPVDATLDWKDLDGLWEVLTHTSL